MQYLNYLSKKWLIAMLVLTVTITFNIQRQSTHAQADPALHKIESDDAQVTPSGTWHTQAADAASEGSYVYNSGEAALSLNFSGPSLEILYVSGPNLGTLAIEVDGTVLRTVITTDSETRYGQAAKINYLMDEPHTLKIYAQGGGTIAVDAFVIAPATPAEAELTSLNDLPADPRYPLCDANPGVSLVSTGLFEPANNVRISADGRYITFVFNDHWIYLRDRATCSLTELIVTSYYTGPFIYDGLAYDLSGNGRYIVFTTRNVHSPLDSQTCIAMPFPPRPQTVSCVDIYRYDRLTNAYALISLDSNNQQISLNSLSQVAISDDGNLVSFTIGGQLHLRDVAAGTTTTWPDFTPVYASSLSTDGRYVAFASAATNVVPNDTNGLSDIFVYDRQTSVFSRVSLLTGGGQIDHNGEIPLISNDGRYVAFASFAANLRASNPDDCIGLFVHDRQTATTTCLNVPDAGIGLTLANIHNYRLLNIAADGSTLYFSSNRDGLVPDDTNQLFDIFSYHLPTQTITRPLANGPAFGNALGGSVIAENGTVMAFSSDAPLTSDDGGSSDDVFAVMLGGGVDTLALWNPATGQVGLLNSQHTAPPALNITVFSPGPPATGQLVMGDWNGNGEKSPGIYAASGVFYYTNQNTAAASWSAIWLGLAGRPPVAGRFNAAVNHDCVGVVDSANFPPHGTAFALYFTCDLTHNTAPALTFQWISVLLPDSGGFTGTHQFSAGDFDGDGVDSIAVRRGTFIAFTNDAPTILAANFPFAQYFGAPATTDEGRFVVGDWDSNGADSFGLYYQSGVFYWRDDLAWNSGVYFNQQVGQPIGSLVQVSAWR